MKTNYRLKDGDTVTLTQPAAVDEYFYDPIIAPRGVWSKLTILPGANGIVQCARTPKVTARRGDSLYFANVDVNVLGVIYRVRVEHCALRKIINQRECGL